MIQSVRSHTVRAASCIRGRPQFHPDVPVYGLIAAGVEYIDHAYALWQPYQSGAFSSQALEIAAFSIFLYPRMLGCAAEIDDHLNRGHNMDTRTPASSRRFVA
jgi:hypothetical protein